MQIVTKHFNRTHNKKTAPYLQDGTIVLDAVLSLSFARFLGISCCDSQCERGLQEVAYFRLP